MERARANYQVTVEKQKEAVAGLTQAKASLAQSEATLAKAKADRGAEGDANASIRAAKAAMEQAELNLEFTEVRAPVDGYVTNLNLRIGSQAVANQPALALVDTNSYWINGFFRENSIEDIRPGNTAIVTLMTYPDSPLEGVVDSLGWGIAQEDGSTGEELLPNISPTFEWIRLAQRVPVRVHLTDVPEEIRLRVGTTASVLVMTREDQDGNVPAVPKALQ
jgi:multidrug resistance efflux pump